MNKQNQILAAIFAVQIFVVVIVFWPEPAVAKGQPLFGDIRAEQIIGVTIRGNDGASFTMAKSPGGWVMPEAGDFPVQEENVSELLDKIVALKSDRLVTRTRDSHKRLQVADDALQRLIEFELEDGTHHKLYLGSSPRFNVLHIRANDEDEVYLALGLRASDAGFRDQDWINTTYLSASQSDITAITLENRQGRFEFEKNEAGDWTMANLPPGETLLENNVISLATRISNVRMIRPLGVEKEAWYGIDDPSATITIVTRDDDGVEKTHILRVGESPEGETGRVVKSATSPYYVLVAPYSVNDMVERGLQDYIKPPPTPTPETPAEATPTPAP
jgi:hypothetical protein